jgi:hypothetical protein
MCCCSSVPVEMESVKMMLRLRKSIRISNTIAKQATDASYLFEHYHDKESKKVRIHADQTREIKYKFSALNFPE